jgi:hypothetical protein
MMGPFSLFLNGRFLATLPGCNFVALLTQLLPRETVP